MLFDPRVIVESPLKLLLAVTIIVIGKTLAAIAIVLIFRYPLRTALTVGASLAQIGEFSFILAGLGVSLAVLPKEGQSLVLAAALISIALNTAVFAAIAPVRAWLLERSALARRLEAREAPFASVPANTDRALLSGQVVLVGYGQVGAQVAGRLLTRKLPFIVIDHNREQVENLRSESIPAVCGEASSADTLVQAHVVTAAMLVVTIRDTGPIPSLIEIARTLNPEIRIILRADNDEDADLFLQSSSDTVVNASEALAVRIDAHILGTMDQIRNRRGGPPGSAPRQSRGGAG
jgi:CPA2 family monovalent cation:H+ antiporter-2